MKVTCPVCDMRISEKRVAAEVEFEGSTYYFCTQACRRQFLADPTRYVQPAAD